MNFIRFKFSRVTMIKRLHPTSSKMQVDESDKHVHGSFEKLNRTKIKSNFLTLLRLIISHNRRKFDVTMTPSNPIGVLFAPANVPRCSHEGSKNRRKLVPNRPRRETWNWFRTRHKPTTAMFCPLVPYLARRTSARCSDPRAKPSILEFRTHSERSRLQSSIAIRFAEITHGRVYCA